MRFYFMRETADANIKSCGVWVHFRTVLFGVAPGWWYADRSGKRPIRKFGINILTPAPWYDRFAYLSVEIGRREYGWFRERIGGVLRFGARP